MADPQPVALVMSALTSSGPMPVPRCTVEPCGGCGAGLWVAPSSRAMPGAVHVCQSCGTKITLLHGLRHGQRPELRYAPGAAEDAAAPGSTVSPTGEQAYADQLDAAIAEALLRLRRRP